MGVLTGKYQQGRPPPSGSRLAAEDRCLFDRYLRPGVLDAVEMAAKLADTAGIPLAQLALAWCLRRPEVTSVLVGASRLAQVEENVAAATVDVSAETFARFEELLVPVATL
jgi:aryl-alcohol dehydrogenase-like predicted oxidoreductase